MSHKKRVFQNSFVMFFCFMIQTLVGFVVRKIFIDYLGVTALGYNAVFTNILTLLNLSELGLGIAVNAFLYQSMTTKKDDEVVAICAVLKKMYRVVTFIILVLGIVGSLFIPILIPNATDSYVYIYFIYALSVISTLTSYLSAQKKTIIISDQKYYVISGIECISYLVISFLQIISMLLWKSYVVYLLLNICKYLITAIIIRRYYTKHYNRFSLEKVDEKLEKKYYCDIVSEMKNIFISKIGGVVFHGTDNIIVSSVLGTISAGFLSNYTLITTTLQNLITQVFSSIQATFGHFIHSNQNPEDQLEIFELSFFVAFILGIISMAGVIFVLPNLIVFLFGQKFLLSDTVTFLLGINLFLMTLLQVPNQIFAIYKLYKYDKYIVGTAAVLNIIISLIFVFIYGIEGVLIGTTITTMIYLISRCYIIKKHVYPHMKYIKSFLIYITSGIIIYCVLRYVDVFYYNTSFMEGILLNSLMVTLISCVIILLIFGKTNIWQAMIKRIKNRK